MIISYRYALFHLRFVISLKMNMEETECAKNVEEYMNTRDPEPLTLPNDARWDIYVTAIYGSTDIVFVRLVGESYSDQLRTFETALEVEFRKEKKEEIAEDIICVAHVEGLFHRVKVITVEDDKIKCIFLDHGDAAILNREQLRQLDSEINRKLPYQAFNVSLHGLGEVADNPTGVSVLSNWTHGRSCVAEPIFSGNSIQLVLYDTSGEVDININEEIMQQICNNMRKTRSCRA
ncbi:hypothetical protein ACJMK2_029723 [Sinanodonta woodiana]|uniref:Tudor domain-containing protein n=1 Tax=Sinanodonta woodiana TaxID=1069815 RepID=A0ABD3XEQ9_SINWO